MTTTPAPTDRDARQDLAEAVAALVAIADKIGAAINYTPQHHTVELTLGNLDQLIRERDAAREELAKTRADLDALKATCSCATTYATYEGPEVDCAVHGAVRALAEAIRERDAARKQVQP